METPVKTNIPNSDFRRGVHTSKMRAHNKIVGTIIEESIIKNLHLNIAEEIIENIMDPPLPMAPEETEVNSI